MKRILVIEEKNTESKKIETILEEAGYKTYLAENGLHGFEIAKRYSPDLILCSQDIQLINGQNLLSELMKFEETFIIPKICILENPNFKEFKRVKALGADDFINRPIEKDELLLLVNLSLKKIDTFKKLFNKYNADEFEEENRDHDHNDHILVKIGNRLNFIKFSEIICITSLKEYSKLILENGKKFIVRKSLRKWIEVLPEDVFLQIHRSTIISMDYIKEVKKLNGRSYQVSMQKINKELILSKRFANKLKKKFITI